MNFYYEKALRIFYFFCFTIMAGGREVKNANITLDEPRIESHFGTEIVCWDIAVTAQNIQDLENQPNAKNVKCHLQS